MHVVGLIELLVPSTRCWYRSPGQTPLRAIRRIPFQAEPALCMACFWLVVVPRARRVVSVVGGDVSAVSDPAAFSGAECPVEKGGRLAAGERSIRAIAHEVTAGGDPGCGKSRDVVFEYVSVVIIESERVGRRR